MLTVDQQAKVISRLRQELDKRELTDVIICASDENSPAAATKTWQELQQADVCQHVGCLNVHSYDALEPWREHQHPGQRTALRLLAERSRVPLRVSEHGNADTTGWALAQTILEDLHFLKPASWCYWQPVEHKSSWGLMEADFDPSGPKAVSLPTPNYFVFAHFTRYLRPGISMLHCTQPWVAAGYSADECAVTCVFANPNDAPRRLRLTFPAFTSRGTADAVVSEPRRGRFMAKQHVEVDGGASRGMEVQAEIPAHSICSLVVPEVQLVSRAVGLRGLSVAHIHDMACAAAWGAADERSYGSNDARTIASWSRWEHICCSAAAVLGDPRHPPKHFTQLVTLLKSGAWGAANERSFGSEHRDTQLDWQRFRAHADTLVAAEGFEKAAADDITWMIFNACWAVVNERWLTDSSADCVEAKGRAALHLSKLGGESIVLRALSPPLTPDV